ncbi:hypothetical protein C9H16_22610 [Salmonella enterica]|nr:hypothetical protein [Salmonella enterica]
MKDEFKPFNSATGRLSPLNCDSLIYNYYKDRVCLVISLYDRAMVTYHANMLKSALNVFRFILTESEVLLSVLDSNDRLLYLKVDDLIVLIKKYVSLCEQQMRENACL